MPGFVIELESRNQDAVQAARQLLGVYKQAADAAQKIDDAVARGATKSAAAHRRTADTAEREARRASAAAEREAAKMAATSDRWAAREYKDRLRYEQAKQREIERTAAKAEREAQRAAAAEARQAKRAADAREREAKRAAEAERRQVRERLSDEQVALRARNAIVDRQNAERVQMAIRASGGRTDGYGGRGRGLLEVGRVVQDFSAGGLLGITNNIEGLAMSFGLGAGLAGALTLAGVAAQIAWPHLQTLFKGIFGGGQDARFTGTEMERLKARIKDIEDKPIKLAVDKQDLEDAERRLERITANLAAHKEFGELRSKAEEESGRRVQEALSEATQGGAPEIQRVLTTRMTSGMIARADPWTKEAEARRLNSEAEQTRQLATRMASQGEDTTGLLASAAQLDEQAKKIRNEIAEDMRKAKEDARSAIGEVFSGAKSGDPKAQARLAGYLRELGRGDVADKIIAAAPANISPELALEEEQKQRNEAARERDRVQEILEKRNQGDRVSSAEANYLEFYRRKQLTQVAPAGIGAIGGFAPFLPPPQIAPGVPGPGAPAGMAGDPHMAAVAAGIGTLVSLAQGQGTGRKNQAPPAMAPPRQPAGWRDRP